MWLDIMTQTHYKGVYMGHMVSKGESVVITMGSMAAGRKVWHWGRS